MFSRLHFESWHVTVTLVAFVLVAGAFAVFVLRACRLRPAERDRLARLPLENDAPPDRAPPPPPAAPAPPR